MTLLLDVARVAAAANVALLVALAAVWADGYRQVRSRQTLGSLTFAALLLGENALAFYYYTFSGIALSAPAVRAMMYLQLLEFVAVAALTYVTYQ
jgi:hypothetical protein